MIYIIEGVDRSGKSTFVDALKKSLLHDRVIVIHSTRPPKDADDIKNWTIDYYRTLINNAIDKHNAGYDVILDRSWISEMVYGPLYRNVIIDINEFESNIKNNIEIFKLCYLHDNVHALLLREDGESDGKTHQLKEQELNLFMDVINKTSIENKLLIDWSSCDFNKDSIELYTQHFIGMTK